MIKFCLMIFIQLRYVLFKINIELNDEINLVILFKIENAQNPNLIFSLNKIWLVDFVIISLFWFFFKTSFSHFPLFREFFYFLSKNNMNFLFLFRFIFKIKPIFTKHLIPAFKTVNMYRHTFKIGNICKRNTG